MGYARSTQESRRPFGYPRWFATLFLTDMWERFSFYGMMAILVLYSAGPVTAGGLGLRPTDAAALFGAYLGFVFVLALPGGWIGDRIIGARRAVLWGGVLIALGHYTMMLPPRGFAFAGLSLIALGTGLLKPNMSVLLSRFYGPGESAGREAAFSIFYISIQLSALLAPIITGFLGETVGWHLGFGAAGVGMTFGVAQFAMGRRHFGDMGERPGHPIERDQLQAVARRVAALIGVIGLLVAVDLATGAFSVTHVVIALALVSLSVPFVYYLLLLRATPLDASGKTRLRAFFWLLVSFSLFWMLAGQAGSMLNLFALHSVDRQFWGWSLPASWFQAAIPFFILITAPFFAWLWTRLGDRVSAPPKFGLALSLVGMSFLIMGAAAAQATAGRSVSPLWLLGVFFLVAAGEVVIGPVGMSASVDVVPPAYTGRVIGLIWLFSALGAGLGSQVVKLADVLPHQTYYAALGLVAVAGGVAMFCARRLRGAFNTQADSKR
ncbi:peptide MFS transporter [Nonomuraea sp. NPDC059007]|uniref:peptide MFS transporter n=1 Tax=Nonomuraea sp. NPDC059007 TaxID=3346692 RepID=UPI00368E8B4D